jgi:hypothetical protein
VIWFGAVRRLWWQTEPTFIVGGGPSLRGFQFWRLGGRQVMGVNRAMFDAPCQVGVSIDRQFVTGYAAQLSAFGLARALYLALGEDRHDLPDVPCAIFLKSRGDAPGLSLDPGMVHRGSTSGYCALNVAVLLGARRIVLLGYDYTPDGHYHDGYPWQRRAFDMSMPAWAHHYEAAAEHCKRIGVEVINASPTSMLTCFPKMTIDEALTT